MPLLLAVRRLELLINESSFSLRFLMYIAAPPTAFCKMLSRSAVFVSHLNVHSTHAHTHKPMLHICIRAQTFLPHQKRRVSRCERFALLHQPKRSNKETVHILIKINPKHFGLHKNNLRYSRDIGAIQPADELWVGVNHAEQFRDEFSSRERLSVVAQSDAIANVFFDQLRHFGCLSFGRLLLC